MIEALELFLEQLGLGNIPITFLVAMLPIIELRGAIPLGVAMGLNPWVSMLVSVLGNLLPVPFIILFIRRIFAWIRKKSDVFERFVSRMERKALKNKDFIYKYQIFGLMLFVAIPLPGTGAWTGAVIAALLNIRMKYAIPAIALGVLIAGIIVTGLTYGFTVAISLT